MKRIISMSLVLIISISLFAHNTDSLQSINGRVEKLEQFQNNLEGRYENKSGELDNQFETLKNKIEKDNNRLDSLLWIFGSVTVIGLAIGWFTVYKTAVSFANKKITESIEKLFIKKKQEFIELIRNHEYETILKESKEIQILSINEEEENVFKNYLNKLDFKKIKYSIYNPENGKGSIKHLKKADVIVINNIKNSFSNDALLSIVQTFTDYQNSFTYYGLFNKELAGYKNINFANSEFTLYSRIIETLKIQDILTK